MRLIDANGLMEYCNNLKGKTIDANDIARFPTAVGWVSVKDRLPKEKEHVLIWIKDLCIIIDWIVNGKWVVTDEIVTHWMPLPEPPKEEN